MATLLHSWIHCPVSTVSLVSENSKSCKSGVSCILFDIESNRCIHLCPSFYVLTGVPDLTGMGMEAFRSIVHPLDFARLLDKLLSIYFCIRRSTGQEIESHPVQFSLRVSMKDAGWLTLQFRASIMRFRNHSGRHLVTGYFESAGVPDNPKVTLREREILQLIANGETSKIVADLLNIAETTVITHRKNLMQKFNVRNTAELIKEAAKTNIII